MSDENTVTQCVSCPWRVGSTPSQDIPGYNRTLHEGLAATIAIPGSTARPQSMRLMACHYSVPGSETICAGWLNHQLGPGNNLAARIAAMTGQLPTPKVDGPQHATFEATLEEDP